MALPPIDLEALEKDLKEQAEEMLEELGFKLKIIDV